MGTAWAPEKLKNHRGMTGKTHGPYARAAIGRAQNERQHEPQEGFQKGHVAYGGAGTRFKNGLVPWNKGSGKGRDIILARFQAYKSNAKKRGLLFELTRDKFREFATGICAYCGDPAIGVDRVDNLLGYVDGNMVACCQVCNHMKHTMGRDNFIRKCKQIITCTGYEV